jgi:hypothetical protein
VDPDGKNPVNPIDLFGQFLSDIGNPVDALLGFMISAFAGNKTAENNANQIGAQFPAMMAQASGQLLISGSEYMSENGSTIALACYASGQIEVGFAVDTLSNIATLGLNVYDFAKTGDTNKFLETMVKDVGLIAIGGLTGSGIKAHIKAEYSYLGMTEKQIEKLTNIFTTIYIKTIEIPFNNAGSIIDE